MSLAGKVAFVAGASRGIGATVAEAWARLRVILHQSGWRIPVNDSWIAATAMSMGVPVVTRDEDYDGVQDLQVIKV